MKEQLLSTLETSKNYSLAVASAMPAAQFGFKPVAEVWTFAELMSHIAYGIHWWEENYIRGVESEWNPPAAVSGKSEAVDRLNEAYEMLGQCINSLKPNTTELNGLHATLDHITHHRGQATTYLRCCGITPPDYAY